jgi:hypothetical protein
MTGRRDLGAILATVGALFVAASSYIHWFADRTAIDTPLSRLYQTSISPPADSWWRSVAVPLIAVLVIAVVGLILRSQTVFFVSWAVGVATLALFVAMQYNDDAVEFAFADLQAGVWQSLVALVVMIFGIAIMGRPPRPEPVPEERPAVHDEETARRADEAAARADEAAGRAAEAAGRADTAAGRRVDTDPARTDTEHVGRGEHDEGGGGWWRRRGRRGEHAEPAETDRAEAERAEGERAEAERIESERAESERAEAERADETERR